MDCAFVRSWVIYRLAFGRTDRGWEWRGGLGCYWFVGLLVTLVVFGWLASIGLPQIVLEPLALATLIGLTVFFILGARGARPPHS